MKLLLDTHVFLCAIRDLAQLAPSSRRNFLIRRTSTSGQRGFGVGNHRLGATRLPIHIHHAVEVWRFRDCRNKAPIDRLLATQAVVEGATLLTADRSFDDFPNLSILWS